MQPGRASVLTGGELLPAAFRKGEARKRNLGHCVTFPMNNMTMEVAIASFLSETRLASFWERLRVSFWFLPSTMAAAAFALSILLVELDRLLGVETVREFGWLYTFGPEGRAPCSRRLPAP